MFRKYECGCLGFSTNTTDPDIHTRRVRCLWACNEHERPHQIHERHMLALKPSRKLTDDEIEELLDTIGRLVDDGYALRELRTALRVAGVEVLG